MLFTSCPTRRYLQGLVKCISRASRLHFSSMVQGTLASDPTGSCTDKRFMMPVRKDFTPKQRFLRQNDRYLRNQGLYCIVEFMQLQYTYGSVHSNVVLEWYIIICHWASTAKPQMAIHVTEASHPSKCGLGASFGLLHRLTRRLRHWRENIESEEVGFKVRGDV